MTTATATTTDQVQRSIWRGIFGTVRGYLGLLSLKDGTKAHQEFFEYPERADAALAWLHREDSAGRNAYACAHLLQSKERTRDTASLVLALWADLDGCPLPTGDLAPSIVLESSPGRFHCWWLLTKAITPARAELLNKRLAAAIGSDPSGSDPSQVLRIVGTHNRKPQYGTPPLVQLHTLSDRHFDPDDLNRSLPLLAEPARPERAPAMAGLPAIGSRPGDDYAARTDWAEILEPHGWTFVERRDDTDCWCRPGKYGAISATTDHDGSDLLYCFTSSTGFEPKRGYGKFSVYALLNHGGDHAAAAKALAAAGYGSQTPTPIRASVTVTTPAEYAGAPCGDQVTALQARIVELEQRNAELERLGEIQRNALRIVQGERDDNAAAVKVMYEALEQGGTTGRTLISIAREFACAYGEGKEPGELIEVYREDLGKRVGVSLSCVTTHTNRLHARGAIVKVPKTVYKPVLNRQTGELEEKPQQRAYMALTTPERTFSGILTALLAVPADEAEPKHGGTQEPKPATPKTLCPDCGAYVEIELHAHCTNCGHNHGPVTPAGEPEALWKQIASIGNEASTAHQTEPIAPVAVIGSKCKQIASIGAAPEVAGGPAAGTCIGCGRHAWRPEGAPAGVWLCDECKAGATREAYAAASGRRQS